jgi:hypothetical protein
LSAAFTANDSCILVPGRSAAFVIEDEGEVEAPSVRFEHAQSQPVLTHDPPQARIVLVFGMPDLDPFESGLIARWVHPQSTLLWDRQGVLSRTKDAVAACGVDARSRIYLANVGEAAQEGGGVTPRQLLENHPLPGFDYALLKNGRWGTTLLSSRERAAIPAFHVAAATTIGSGDVFAGALAAGLAQGRNIRAASTDAAAAAAVAISGTSPLLDLTSRDSIEEIVASANGRYVDPTHLDQVSVVVDAGSDSALAQAAAELRARLVNVGLAGGGAESKARMASKAMTVVVELRRHERRLLAVISSSRSATCTAEFPATAGSSEFLDVVADYLEATQH